MKKHLLTGAGLIIYTALVVSCSDTKPGKTLSGDGKAVKNVAIDMANFDVNTKPQDDFYQYVNGNWLKNTAIPGTESRWSSFNELADRNKKVLKEILKEAIEKKDAPKGSTWQMVGDFYASGMDSAAIEAAGLKPLQKELNSLAGIKTKEDVIIALADWHKAGGTGLFSFFVNADRKNSTKYAAYLSQGGLGLPDRSYYLEANFEKKRAEYAEHIANMFKLAGDDESKAKQQAQQILALETELAKLSRERAALRDAEKNYNKMSLEQLSKLSPQFDWKKYLNRIGASAAQELIVGQPEFFTGVNRLLAETPVETWQAYLRWNLLRGSASALPKAFVEESFAFYSKNLRGIQAMKARWERIQDATNSLLGEPLGKLYVERAFSPKAKARAEQLIGNLRLAFADHIRSLDWMSATTKEQALKKLNAIVYKIGYPDKWKSYEGLEIKRGSYLENLRNISQYEFDRRVKRIGQTVDRSEWFMSPPTVNAYYSPTMNEIVFPAGILQAPFFDANADDAVNYGGIGTVIGHELTHGFDDQGSRYDADGNMKNWWTKEDSANFAAKTQALVEQFNSYTLPGDIRINGKLTLGENIADLGGVAIAFDALKKALAAKGGKAALIDGFTPEQRFFINWAQIWRSQFRPQALQEYVRTDSHSPGVFRTNGPLSNTPAFFDAFQIKPGDKMRRDNLIIIW